MKIEGVELHVVEKGSGEPVLFGHGLLWAGWMFDAQVAALSDRYRCVTVDWRGQGKSEVTASGYDMDTLTGDAIGVIRALNLAPVHYVGLSMGGFIGMRLAARHPELVRSLTLLETSADPEPPENVPRYRKLNLVARWVGLGPVANKVMPIMFGKTFLNDPAREAERNEYRRRLVANHRVGITRATAGVIDRKPVYDELKSIRCPTLILVGDEDVATKPEKARRMNEAIAGSRLVTIPGAGHSSTVEQPSFVSREIRTFLEGVGKASGVANPPGPA